jgi:hypothetical protein
MWDRSRDAPALAPPQSTSVVRRTGRSTLFFETCTDRIWEGLWIEQRTWVINLLGSDREKVPGMDSADQSKGSRERL